MRQIIAVPYGYSLRHKHESVSPAYRGCRPEQDYKLSSPGVYTYPRPPNAFYDDVILVYALLYCMLTARACISDEYIYRGSVARRVRAWMYLTLLNENDHMRFLPVRNLCPGKDLIIL